MFFKTKNKILQRIRREVFLPSGISIFFNPVYIIRKGLFDKISRVAPKLDGDILDFGCGSKPYESLFPHVRSYIGVDLAITGHKHDDSKIDFFYDGHKLPFNDNSFDAVVCFEVFEHVFNLNEILLEIHRVLKPNGKLLITIPFAWDEHEVPFDFARYTSFGIKDILCKSNFNILEHHKTTTYVLAIFQLIIAYFYQFVLPGKSTLMKVLRSIIIFPLNSIAIIFDRIFPKRYEFYCNNVLLVEKAN